MDDITVVSEATIDEIKEALLFNDEITAITSSVIYGGASRLVSLLFKGHPALKVVDALVYTIELNSALIANQLKFMGENNYTVFVTTSTKEISLKYNFLKEQQLIIYFVKNILNEFN